MRGTNPARELIDNSLDQAVTGLRRSIQEGNEERRCYWLERVLHLMDELNWIDKLIIELEADADQSNPPSQHSNNGNRHVS